MPLCLAARLRAFAVSTRVPALLMGLLFIADATGRVERAIADATDVLDRVDANDDAHHLVRAFTDGANLLLRGDPARAADRFTEAIEIGEHRGGDVLLPFTALGDWGPTSSSAAGCHCRRLRVAQRSLSMSSDSELGGRPDRVGRPGFA